MRYSKTTRMLFAAGYGAIVFGSLCCMFAVFVTPQYTHPLTMLGVVGMIVGLILFTRATRHYERDNP